MPCEFSRRGNLSTSSVSDLYRFQIFDGSVFQDKNPNLSNTRCSALKKSTKVAG